VLSQCFLAAADADPITIASVQRTCNYTYLNNLSATYFLGAYYPFCGVTMSKLIYLYMPIVLLSSSFLVMGSGTVSKVATKVVATNTDLQTVSSLCTLQEKVVIGFAGCNMIVTVATLDK
jgi:hypothetical protein